METSRDIVHYRFDAIIPDYGPLATAPLIEQGISTQAGSRDISSILEGVIPQDAERLTVSGVDGRTSAYKFNDITYIRTPHTMLSPSWSQSVASADGMRVYEIQNAPVLLLSDKGKMVRARLSAREAILDE
jgi:intracellular multiplication protein IcmK